MLFTINRRQYDPDYSVDNVCIEFTNNFVLCSVHLNIKCIVPYN